MFTRLRMSLQTSKLFTFCNKQSPVKLWLGVLWTAILIGLFFLSFQFTDSDLYYMIPTGNYIMDHGIIPDVNPFITTEGSGIVLQNWLYCVLIAFVYKYLNTLGLYLVQVLFLITMFAVTAKFFGIKYSRNKILIGSFIMFIMWTFSYLNLRPEMLTYILILLELLGLEAYLKTNKRRYLWLLPITMLLEINMHASYWIMHIIVLLPYLVPIPEKFFKTKNKAMSLKQCNGVAPFIGLSAAVLFLNPYGLDGILYVINSLLSRVFDIFAVTEQQSFVVWSIYPILLFIELLLFDYVYKKKALDSISCFMYLGFFVLTLHTLKWVAFYAIGLAYLLRCITKRLEERNGFNFAETKTPMYCNIVLIVFYVIAIFTLPDYNTDMFSATNHNYLDLAEGTGFDEFDEVCDYLDEYDADASVMSLFQYSNYFEYRGYPVFYDARPELYIPEISGMNVMQSVLKYEYGLDTYGFKMSKSDTKSYMDFRMTAAEYDIFVDTINTDYFLVQSVMSLQNFYFELHPEKYDCVMTTDNWFLYRRLNNIK